MRKIWGKHGRPIFSADVRTEKTLHTGAFAVNASCTSILRIIAKGTVRIYAETKQSVSAKEKRCFKMLDTLCSIPYLVHAVGVWKGLPESLKGVRGPAVQCLSVLVCLVPRSAAHIYKDRMRLPVRPDYLSGAIPARIRCTDTISITKALQGL